MPPVESSSVPSTAPLSLGPTPTGVRISVVMPNYNHGHFMRISLPALLNQSYAAHEIVVLDDASKDDSVAYVKSLQTVHPSIRLLRHESNQGVIATMNEGVQAATGDVIYFAAADDEAYPGLFAEAARQLGAHPTAGFFCSDGAHYDEVTHELHIHHLGLPENPPFYSPQEFLPVLRKLPIFFFDSHTILFRRSYFFEAGGMAPELGYRTDWFFFWVVVARHGFCYSPQVLAKFVRRRSSFSMVSSANTQIEDRVWQNVLAKLRDPVYRDVRPFLLATALYTDSEIMLRRILFALVRTPANWPMLRPGLVVTWLRRRYGNLFRRAAHRCGQKLRRVYKFIRCLIMESW